MKQRFLLLALALILSLALASQAWGFDLLQAKTEAKIHPPDPSTPVVQLNFRAQLENNGFTDLPDLDVVINWGKSGGVEPVPFKCSIPARCFVPNAGFHVEDFRGCGVELTFDPDGRGPVALSIVDFEARLRTRRDGTTRFDVETSFTDLGREHAILGALGGGVVEIAIGAEMALALPLGIEALSGIQPQPF